jgi:Na+/proline symporter
MRAVIWTDAIQSLVMIGVTLAALIVAVDRSGGLASVYDTLRHEGMLIDPSYYFGSVSWAHTPASQSFGKLVMQ